MGLGLNLTAGTWFEVAEYAPLTFHPSSCRLNSQPTTLSSLTLSGACQIERGNDLFESARAQSFSDGAAEALTATLRQLEDIQEMQESALEWNDDSVDESWESGVLA